MDRSPNVHKLSYFWDLYRRKLLNMDPPYQRRSVWNQQYKDYFIETVLLGYPCPAIFVYQEITEDGESLYSIVDGKQRLSTLFEFASGEFPVSEKCKVSSLKGKYFSDMSREERISFWSYIFIVENIPHNDEAIINEIFDRINRNVVKLTPQELRHARFDGEFISAADELTEYMYARLPSGLPNFAKQSKKQMKDIEYVSQLMLLIEEGVRSYSQVDLDIAYSERDENWENSVEVIFKFRSAIDQISSISAHQRGPELLRTRVKNQADFYSFFGAISNLISGGSNFDINEKIDILTEFFQAVDQEERRADMNFLKDYYNDARSASNDAGPRRRRIETIQRLLLANELQELANDHVE